MWKKWVSFIFGAVGIISLIAGIVIALAGRMTMQSAFFCFLGGVLWCSCAIIMFLEYLNKKQAIEIAEKAQKKQKPNYSRYHNISNKKKIK